MNLVIFALMIATLLVVIAGVVVMARGGKLNRKYSNKLMSLRVGLQALVVALVFVIALVAKQ